MKKFNYISSGVFFVVVVVVAFYHFLANFNGFGRFWEK